MLALQSLIQCAFLLLVAIVAATRAADLDGNTARPQVKEKKCKICTPPSCLAMEQYVSAFDMTMTKRSDPYIFKEFTGHYPGSASLEEQMTASYTTIYGQQRNGSITLSNHLDGNFLVSTQYAQQLSAVGKRKREPVTVNYLIGINEDCYHDMPKGLYTSDVLSVKIRSKRD